MVKTTVCGVLSSTRKFTHFSITSPTASRSLPEGWNTWGTRSTKGVESHHFKPEAERER